MSRFPDKFMIGASTAAHQVEGSNTNSDYWAMEHLKHTNFNEPSLNAVDHYNRYEEDIRLMAEAGLNTYRFSIEWARIEPEEGKFDEAETEHYRKVLKCCRNHGIEPVVTMMHFTSPVWLIQKGGWESESTVKYFVRYCAYLAEKLSHYTGISTDVNIVQKVLKTKSQKKLNALQRRKNLEKAFCVTGDVRGKNILVIDDVYTTGSTIDAMAGCLKRKGAGNVYFLTVCIGRR